jgi:DNA polymerase III, beta subunit
MKFTCETKLLSKACQTVAMASATRAGVPALEGIKIDVKDGNATLCGYNLELGITTALGSNGECEDGSIVLDAKMLCNMAKKMPDFLTTIATDEKGIATVSSGESKFEVVGIPAGEFPELPKVDEKSSISITQPILKGMIQQTVYAVSDSDCRPVHTGAQFTISGGELTVVGLDGYRLAICKETVDYSGAPLDFVVPKNALSEISKLLSNSADDMASISVGTRHAAFTIGDYTVFTRLLEGEFLDWRKAIPKECSTSLKVDTKSFKESVERVGIMISGRVNSPIISEFSSADGTITVSSNTAVGRASDSISAEISGADVKIGFNNKYLIDALSHAECDEVRLQLNGPLSPMVVSPDDGDSFLFLVLPVRMKAGDAE